MTDLPKVRAIVRLGARNGVVTQILSSESRHVLGIQFADNLFSQYLLAERLHWGRIKNQLIASTEAALNAELADLRNDLNARIAAYLETIQAREID